MVYIQEAHPTDLWQMASNIHDGVLFRSPRSATERSETASASVRNLGIRIPALLDGIDNRIERAYTGWPDRLYLIGRDGRVIYKSLPGPYGFSSRKLEQALRQLPGETVRAANRERNLKLSYSSPSTSWPNTAAAVAWRRGREPETASSRVPHTDEPRSAAERAAVGRVTLCHQIARFHPATLGAESDGVTGPMGRKPPICFATRIGLEF